MRKTFKRTILFLVIAFAPILLYLLPLVQGVTAKEAFAAEKAASLDTTEITMGFHHTFSGGISIENANMDAEYSYKSSNKKVVTVHKEFGWLDDVSIGTAYITVTETLGGESRELGKVKVKVVGAFLDKEFKIGLSGRENSADIQVPIKYQNYSATYIYQTADPNIVEVTSYGNMYSKKLGSTYISITERYKGKVTKLGKIKVNVVKAQPAFKKVILPVTVDGYFIDRMVKYANRNNTTYRFTSSNKKILDVDEEWGSYLYTKDYGKAKINITEINLATKKTRMIGSTIVEIVPASIDPDYKDIEVEYNSTQSLGSYLHFKNINYSATYSCKVANSSMISVSSKKFKDPDTGLSIVVYYLKGLKKGETAITVYEEYNGHKTAIGTVNAIVKETITRFEFDPDYLDYEDGILSTTFYLDDENSFNNLSEVLAKEPYEDMSAVSFSSSDENVVKVDSKGNITLIAKGTVILKATCEDWTTELKMTVE